MSAKKILLIAAVLLAIAAAVHYFSGRSADSTELHNSTDRTLERVEGQQQKISDEAAGSRAAIADAQHAANGISGAIERSQEADAKLADGLDAIRRTVKECRDLAEANAQIIDGAGSADK